MLKIGYMLGDDIGLEVVPETVKVMRAAALEVGLDLDWREFPLGRKGHELHGHTLPEVTVAGLRETDGFITGPIGHNAYPRNDPTWIMPPRTQEVRHVREREAGEVVRERRVRSQERGHRLPA